MMQQQLLLNEDETVEVAILHLTSFRCGSYDEKVTIAKAIGENNLPWASLKKEDYEVLSRNIDSVYAPGISGLGGQLVVVRRLDLATNNPANLKDVASVIEACQQLEAERVKQQRRTELAKLAREKKRLDEERLRAERALAREKAKLKKLLKTNPELVEEAKAELQGLESPKSRVRKATATK